MLYPELAGFYRKYVQMEPEEQAAILMIMDDIAISVLDVPQSIQEFQKLIAEYVEKYKADPSLLIFESEEEGELNHG